MNGVKKWNLEDVVLLLYKVHKDRRISSCIVNEHSLFRIFHDMADNWMHRVFYRPERNWINILKNEFDLHVNRLILGHIYVRKEHEFVQFGNCRKFLYIYVYN